MNENSVLADSRCFAILTMSLWRPREPRSPSSSSLDEDDVSLPLSSSAAIGAPSRSPWRIRYSIAMQTMWRTHCAAYPAIQRRSGMEGLSSWLSTRTTAETRTKARFHRRSSATTGRE
uniref:Uncharacterized protein n=1 Tax=Arundo donax TaxID=35708 RepID=A0A0A9GN33_ARUDO